MRTLKFLRGTEAGGAGPGVRRAPLRSSWLIFRETEGCEHRAWPVREPGGRGHGHPRTPRGCEEAKPSEDAQAPPAAAEPSPTLGRRAGGGEDAESPAGTVNDCASRTALRREWLCARRSAGSTRRGCGRDPVPSLGPAPTADVRTGCSASLALLSPSRRRTAGGAGSRWVSVAATSSAASDGDPGCAQTSSADRPRRATALGVPSGQRGGRVDSSSRDRVTQNSEWPGVTKCVGTKAEASI